MKSFPMVRAAILIWLAIGTFYPSTVWTFNIRHLPQDGRRRRSPIPLVVSAVRTWTACSLPPHGMNLVRTNCCGSRWLAAFSCAIRKHRDSQPLFFYEPNRSSISFELLMTIPVNTISTPASNWKERDFINKAKDARYRV